MPRRAFTLVELMVVIMVIAALAALAIPAIGFARQKAKQVKTVTLMSQVQAALEKIKLNNGTYPEGPTQPSNPPAGVTVPTLVGWDDHSRFGSGTSVNLSTVVSPDAWKAINHDLLIHLHNVDPENFSVELDQTLKDTSPTYYLRDTLGASSTDSEVLRYRPAKFYPFISGATKLIDSDDPPGSDSYQLWSCGKDAIDDQGESSSDDLTSWKKRAK